MKKSKLLLLGIVLVFMLPMFVLPAIVMFGGEAVAEKLPLIAPIVFFISISATILLSVRYNGMIAAENDVETDGVKHEPDKEAVCPHCGSFIGYGDRNYCPNCGKKIEDRLLGK